MLTTIENRTNINNFLPSQILRLTRRIPNIDGNGGDHRALQIQELIYSTNHQIVDVFKKLNTKEWIKYLSGLEFLLKSRFQVYPFYNPVYPIDIYHFYRVFKILGEELLNYKSSVNQYTGKKLLVWEFTDKLVAPYLLKRKGFKVIGVPHNLQSLDVDLRDSYNRQKTSIKLEKELNYLAKADAIFTISREEQWLLNLYGIKADFLPYYPPEPLLSRLLAIREKRKKSEPHCKKRFLILGTAKNPPTFQGMVNQIETLDLLAKKIDFIVDLAGYNTEKLKNYCVRPYFNLCGTVSNEKLEQLLIEAKAVLIEQRSGVGALTRIPEMLVAGIPVIANGNACRSAFSYEGVYTYDSNNELETLMDKELTMPNLLERPIEAEKRFTECLVKFSQDKKILSE